jgi:hypothetical protein
MSSWAQFHIPMYRTDLKTIPPRREALISLGRLQVRFKPELVAGFSRAASKVNFYQIT